MIARSATPGGDGHALTMDIAFGAMHDIGIKYNLKEDGISIVEHADVIPPLISRSELNLTYGILKVFTSETIDSTPGSNVNVTLIKIANLSDGTDGVSIVAKEVLEVDKESFQIKLTEKRACKGYRTVRYERRRWRKRVYLRPSWGCV